MEIKKDFVQKNVLNCRRQASFFILQELDALVSPNQYSSAEFVGSFWKPVGGGDKATDILPRAKEWASFTRKLYNVSVKLSSRGKVDLAAILTAKQANQKVSLRTAVDCLVTQLTDDCSYFAKRCSETVAPTEIISHEAQLKELVATAVVVVADKEAILMTLKHICATFAVKSGENAEYDDLLTNAELSVQTMASDATSLKHCLSILDNKENLFCDAPALIWLASTVPCAAVMKAWCNVREVLRCKLAHIWWKLNEPTLLSTVTRNLSLGQIQALLLWVTTLSLNGYGLHLSCV